MFVKMRCYKGTALFFVLQAQDRITKLYSVYCKFLLSFETLSDEERHKIEHAIQTDRQKHEKHRSPGNTETCIEKVSALVQVRKYSLRIQMGFIFIH